MPNILVISPDLSWKYHSISLNEQNMLLDFESIYSAMDLTAASKVDISYFPCNKYILGVYYECKNDCDKPNLVAPILLHNPKVNGNIVAVKYIDGKCVDITYDDFLSIYKQCEDNFEEESLTFELDTGASKVKNIIKGICNIH